ncbi:D-galactose-binding periplasmic protein [Clostridiales bacterium]|nr:D-galactose-binding periplasmic protein [Clostridiales bacterium]
MGKKGSWLIYFCASVIVIGGILYRNYDEVDKALQIGVSIYLDNDTFVDKITSGMVDAAQVYEKETGKKIILNISAANGSQRLQNEQVKRFMSIGCDAICVNLVDRTSASAIIDIALEENPSVPVIFFNREPVFEDIMRGERIYYVGTDSKQTAVLQGRAIVESLYRRPEMDKNGDGVLQYVMIEGEMGHQDTIMRSDYSVQTIAEAGIHLQKLDSGTADWNRVRAKALMEQWIELYGDDIELAICNNDDMALGVTDVLEAADISVAVFGIDATGVGMEALSEGKLWGTVDCNGTAQGQAVLSLAAGIADEGRVPGNIKLSEERYVRVPLYKVIAEI